MQLLPEFVRDAFDDSDADLAEVTSILARTSVAWANAQPPARVPAPDKLLATVSSPRLRYAPFFAQLKELWHLDEMAIEAVFAHDKWRRTPLPGIRVRDVALPPHLSHCRARVSLFGAGTYFPRHTHRALEHVLVLEGSYVDSDSGVNYGPGDLHSMPAGTAHGFTVARSGRCVAASIHNAPFEFHSWPLRLLARVSGN